MRVQECFAFYLLNFCLLLQIPSSLFEKGDGETINNYSEFLNFGDKKASKLDKTLLENSIIKSKVDVLGEVFKKNIDALKSCGELDLIFLVDGSSSVGEKNFKSELKFVKKLMSDITVDYNHTRVAIVTFSSAENVLVNVDEITTPSTENNKCLLLNKQLNNIKYSGGGTYTVGAFKKAKEIFDSSRNSSKKALFLITDGFSNGGDPIPVANELKQKQVTIFTIGIQSGNYKELHELSTAPGELYSYLLDGFQEFESLARRALHVDLQTGDYIPLGSNKLCDKLCEEGDCCDTNAVCTCGTSTGHYSCLCQPGFYGSGLKNSCLSCPSGSYANGPNLCLPCPDVHHVTQAPAIGISSCQCKDGFKAVNNFRCEVLKCPKLSVPEHGYFVKRKECGNVLYSACGIRCEVGYTLTGSSIRLCQINGTWSGESPSCQVKVCDPLPPPSFGSVSCFHSDLGITYDQSETELPVDTTCTFSCETGYSLIGSKQRTCLPLARWDGLRSSCREIKCSKLIQIQNGKIEPESCLTEKQSYGANCTNICNEGFENNGPKVISCVGEHGSWKPKPEQPACVDNTSPKIVCPEDIIEQTLPGKKFGIVNWTEPIATDNSGLPVNVWTKPAIKNLSKFKFDIGKTVVTYFAQDAFKNRAKCKFIVHIQDKEIPMIEECESPPIFLSTDKLGANVSWDEPNIFDNSQNVQVLKSHDFGFFPIGTTKVNYTATDPSNNTNTCILNITIEDPHCDALPDPIYGHSDCASNKDSVNCVITCQEGYAIPLAAPSDIVNIDVNSGTSFICNHSDPVWYNQEGMMFPECSVTALPNEVEQNGIIKLQPTEGDVCDDNNKLNELDNDIQNSLQTIFKSSCADSSCELNTNTYCEEEEESDEEEKSNIIKRETHVLRHEKRKHKKKKRVNVKFHLKTENDVQAMLNNSAIQNNLLNHLKGIDHINGKNISVDFYKPKLTCPLGFVLKKNRCVQCPKGSYHSLIANKCQSCPIGYYNENVGQTVCKTCPLHHSTRKLHSKSNSDCKEECPPGTRARKKIVKPRKHSNVTLHRITLKPHCKSCPLGTYQPEYGQTQCIKCPEGYNTTSVGAFDYLHCIPEIREPCSVKANICNNGQCVPDNQGHYSCNCFDNYIGTHCEIKLNDCSSNPCLNYGVCIPEYNDIGYTCSCKGDFMGRYCEERIERCRCENSGHCVEGDDGQLLCICPDGYYGDLCEEKLVYCQENICQNNGKCLEHTSSYSCSCTDGFIGRSCGILPCDYQPCFGNSYCTNLLLSNATKESYSCNCPQGYKGLNCTEKIDYCLSNPCLNGGKCFNNATDYYCACPKTFNGFNCEIKREVSYSLKFSKYDTTSFVKLKGFEKNLTEITVCLWMRTMDNFNYGTLISYANHYYDNAFTLTDYSGLVLYVNNEHRITDIYLNDGFWHHICASWKNALGSYSIFVDGVLLQNSTGLAVGKTITGFGDLVVGQDQDILGGKFSESESFLGEMAHINFWSRMLSLDEVIDDMHACNNDVFGDIYGWPEFKEHIYGDIVIEKSKFCTNCEMPRPLYNGFINVVDKVAYYKCNTGFLISDTSYTTGRKCTKASMWEGNLEPYCEKVKCGHPGFVRNGHIIGRGYHFLDKITYKCFDGYSLIGNSTRICTENGTWAPEKPTCSGVQCKAFKKPENSEISIMAEHSYEDFTENVSLFDAGTQIEIICASNANLTGENILTCQENGTWDFEPPQCAVEKPDSSSKSVCSLDQIPKAPSNGYIVSETLSAVGNGTSDTVEYKCRMGFKLKGENASVCIVDGYWSEPNITCDPILCPEPPAIKNMNVKHVNTTDNVYHFGNIVTYECIDGYRMFGNNVLRCLANGRWTRMQGKCTKKSCRKPITADSTAIEGNSYLFEDQVTLICANKQQYVLTCNKDAQWIGEKDSSC